MDDIFYMKAALSEAKKAASLDEVPVGAVIVKENEIIAAAHNKRETDKNALMHAEIAAIDLACKKLKKWRLDDCTMYVTLEPCPMCAGAALQAKLKRVVFGAFESKFGAVGSVFNMFYDFKYNHSVLFTGGVLEEECTALMRDFFEGKREGTDIL